MCRTVCVCDRAVRCVVCQTMFALDDEQITNYRKLFAAMDADGGGSLVSNRPWPHQTSLPLP